MWLQTCKKKPIKNFGDVIEVRNRSKISRDSWVKAWLFQQWSGRSVLKLGRKSALREGQISQVSNEVRENSRALFNDGSRNVVYTTGFWWNGCKKFRDLKRGDRFKKLHRWIRANRVRRRRRTVNVLRGDCRLKRVDLRHKIVREHVAKRNIVASTSQLVVNVQQLSNGRPALTH